MERGVASKLLLVLTFVLMVFASTSEGARTLKTSNEKDIDEPQNFFGGGSFPTPPGFSGTFPSPGFGGSFPSPGFSFGPPGSGNICMFFPGSLGCAPANPGTGSPGGSP